VAYYTVTDLAGAHETPPAAEQLSSHLAAKLPEYMVPAAYVKLDHLPLMPNGKMDRKALPAPEGDVYAVRGYAAPQGETESILAGIWVDVLQVGRVGRWDDFFHLGGHSLLAVRVISRVRQEFGVELAISEVFRYPALFALADRIVNSQLAQFDAIRMAQLLHLRRTCDSIPQS
jgi:acyl carrier protein